MRTHHFFPALHTLSIQTSNNPLHTIHMSWTYISTQVCGNEGDQCSICPFQKNNWRIWKLNSCWTLSIFFSWQNHFLKWTSFLRCWEYFAASSRQVALVTQNLCISWKTQIPKLCCLVYVVSVRKNRRCEGMPQKSIVWILDRTQTGEWHKLAFHWRAKVMGAFNH